MTNGYHSVTELSDAKRFYLTVPIEVQGYLAEKWQNNPAKA
jgi:hypothetical protein